MDIETIKKTASELIQSKKERLVTVQCKRIYLFDVVKQLDLRQSKIKNINQSLKKADNLIDSNKERLVTVQSKLEYLTSLLMKENMNAVFAQMNDLNHEFDILNDELIEASEELDDLIDEFNWTIQGHN